MNTERAAAPVSRRTIAKGAAWAVPAIAVASAAPAYAASRQVLTTSVCQLFYGSGTVNYQTHSIYLGVTSDSGVVPAGTTLSWTVSMSGSGNEVPTTNYSPNDIWDISLSPAAGTVASTFTATLTFNQDLEIGTGTWCDPALVWTNVYAIRPATSVTVSSDGAVGGGAGTVSPGGLTYTVAKRHPTSVNQSGRSPHVYTSRSGVQACWPEIQYSRLITSNGKDNVTTYPAGTAVTTTPCTWNGTSCTGTSGTSTPRSSSTAQDSQYLQSAVC